MNVSVAPAAAIEFQHFKDVVIEKINSYFGYKAIADLRIHQNYIPKEEVKKISNLNVKNISKIDKKNIKSKVENMENNDLKKSLISLGMNITKGSE